MSGKIGVERSAARRSRSTRGLRWTAGWLLLLASCSGPKVFVNFPDRAVPAGNAPAGAGPAGNAPAEGSASPNSPAEGSPATAAASVPPASGAQPTAPPNPAPAPVSAAPPAEPPLPEEPLPPYWALYADWRAEHEDILRKMETATFSLRSLENMFRDSEAALRLLGRRLDSAGRADLEAFLERYGKLRRQAVADIHRGILRDRLYRLGCEISARFAPK